MPWVEHRRAAQRSSNFYISFGREQLCVLERSPSPERIYVREPSPARFIQNNNHAQHAPPEKKAPPANDDPAGHRYKEIKRELVEMRKERQMVQKRKERAEDFEEFKAADAESKELGEKIKWFEKKLDAEWKKAMGD